jgi:hypothetical protein
MPVRQRICLPAIRVVVSIRPGPSTPVQPSAVVGPSTAGKRKRTTNPNGRLVGRVIDEHLRPAVALKGEASELNLRAVVVAVAGCAVGA